MKVLRLCALFCFWAMKEVMSIGRWSDESFVRVVQVVLLVRWVGRMVRSGDVGCCRWRWDRRGNRMGWLSLIMEWVESFMMLLMVIPLWSFGSSMVVWFLYGRRDKSSAYSKVWTSCILGKLHNKSMNNKGLKIEPWGTPHLISCSSEKELPTLTRNRRPRK